LQLKLRNYNSNYSKQQPQTTTNNHKQPQTTTTTTNNHKQPQQPQTTTNNNKQQTTANNKQHIAPKRRTRDKDKETKTVPQSRTQHNNGIEGGSTGSGKIGEGRLQEVG